MTLCACGCGEEITELPHHAYAPARYKPGHYQKSGLAHRGHRYSSKRIPPDTVCACGCGTPISEFMPSGLPRYANTDDGRFYVAHHEPRRLGADSPKWKGGRLVDTHGYIRVHKPGHHLANKHGYVLEHRLIWEEANGRRLKPDEQVHHINHDRQDNRPGNLVALSRSAHAHEHEYWKQNNQTHEDHVKTGHQGAAKRWEHISS